MIKEFSVTGENLSQLQEELSNFLSLDIVYSNPFDDEQLRQGIPIDIPKVAVSYGDMRVNIIQKHNMQVLPRVIYWALEQYCGDTDYDIINCWATNMKVGSEGLIHHHLPTELSGVYYYAVDPNDSQIELMTDGEFKSYASATGKLIMWPANTLHRIPFKTLDTLRCSISFNLVRSYQNTL